jgi:hypothetical protein
MTSIAYAAAASRSLSSRRRHRLDTGVGTLALKYQPAEQQHIKKNDE